MSQEDTSSAYITSQTIWRTLLWTDVALLALHFIHLIVIEVFRYRIVAFDLNAETNFPALISTIYLAAAAYLCQQVGIDKKKQKHPYWRPWYGLGFLFGFFALDEYFGIHEILNKPIRSAFDLTGALYFSWVIPYALLLVFFGVVYFRFLFFGLERKFQTRFIVSGLMYVTGALVFESVGAGRRVEFGRSDRLHTLFTTIEESLEIFGISLFIYFVYQYIEQHQPTRRLTKTFWSNLLKVVACLLVLCAIYNVRKILI